MAARAVTSKHSQMHFWIDVAGHAVYRRAAVAVIWMAVSASRSGMTASQRINLIVVEELHLAAAIVALQAAISVSQPVFFHVGRILNGVAGDAVQRAVDKAILPVAGLAI